MLKYCLNRYETQEMRDKAFNAFLPALNFVPDWFVTKKNTIEKPDDTLFANHTITFINVDSNKVTFFGSHTIWYLYRRSFSKINLDDLNFDDYYPETIPMSELWVDISKE